MPLLWKHIWKSIKDLESMLALLLTIPFKLGDNHVNFYISSICLYKLGTEEQKPIPDAPPCYIREIMTNFSSLIVEFPWNVPTVGLPYDISWVSLVPQTVKNPPTMQETWVRSLGWEDPLEKGTATHSNILDWRIPWTEEPGSLQSGGCKESDKTERLSLSQY